MLLCSVAAMTVLTGFERVRPARHEHADTQRNLMIWAFNLALGLAVFDAVSAAETRWLAGWTMIPHLDLAAMPFALGAVVYILAADFAEWFVHRIQHGAPALWRLHSLHHSDGCMSVTTTHRHHWAADLLSTAIRIPPLTILLHPSAAQIGCFAVASIWVLVCHTNVNLQLGVLNYVFNSPNNHRIHHSREPEHYNVNYANIFTIWDVLTGNYLDPRRVQLLPATGLETSPRNIGEALIWPLLKGSEG